jgi:HAD superfamily hydrolase (TIGR01484 family)
VAAASDGAVFADVSKAHCPHSGLKSAQLFFDFCGRGLIVTPRFPMGLPIQLISTDFDGTLHSGFEHPPIPADIERVIKRLQERGAKWIINTGRDLTSLMEELTRAQLSIRPDFVVVVEREIYKLEESKAISVDEWNDRCTREHEALFRAVRPQVPAIERWIKERYPATVYEDAYSPFCLIAENTRDAEAIHDYLELYCSRINNLTVMRNDIYARFSHVAFNKGTAMAEVARRLGIARENVFAAGDHLNDLPMLSTEYAHWLVAPVNAIPVVKETVRRQNGYVSHQSHGYGVARGLEFFLESSGALA